MAKKGKTEEGAGQNGLKHYARKVPSSAPIQKQNLRFLSYPLSPNVTYFTILRTSAGFCTLIGHALNSEFSNLAEIGVVDAFIFSTEDGFSPLGTARQFLATDLGIDEQEISECANWNRFENERVTLIGLTSRRSGSLLKGVILAPGESSKCYERFRANRKEQFPGDFYYHVTHEAIAQASRMWGARRLGLSHLSATGNFNEDIASSSAQALARFCDAQAVPRIESLVFVGCCIEPRHLEGIKHLNAEARYGPAKIETWTHLSWG